MKINSNNLEYISGAQKAFKNIKDIFVQLNTMGGLVIPDNQHGQYTFEIPNYYGRFLVERDETKTSSLCSDLKLKPTQINWYIIQFSIKEYFDRWANSNNFEMIVYPTNDNRNFFWSMNKVVEFMDTVRKMKYFDWNSYFHTIEIPFQQK